MFQRDFYKITAVYTLGIIVTFGICWILLLMAIPDSKLDIITTLTTAFGVNLPNDMPIDLNTNFRTGAVVLIISLLSIGLVILNVFFSAIITARFIRPRVALLLSSRGVLSTTWNATWPYALVRMANFYRADLVNVEVDISLLVEETHMVDGKPDMFRTYFPVEQYTPKRILIMEQRMPWSIAVHAECILSNSRAPRYPFRPGRAIVDSIARAGMVPVHVKRTLQILIQGTDARTYSSFVVHQNVVVDEQNGKDYVLHLHKGSFKSLPLRILDAADIEKFAEPSAT